MRFTRRGFFRRAGTEEAKAAVPLDLLSKSFDQDPARAHRVWRANGQVQHFAANDAWVVLGYDVALNALKDAASFSSAPYKQVFSSLLHGADAPGDPRVRRVSNPFFADGPEHTRVRRVLNPFFTASRQTAGSANVRTITERAAAKVAARESFRLIADFAEPVALGIACDWLGIDERVGARLMQLPLDKIDWGSVEPALKEGLILDLARSRELSDDELAHLVGFFLAAAVPTSRHFIFLAVHALARNPEALLSIQTPSQDWSAIADELLRWEPPVHALLRSTTRDVALGDVTIPKGSLVWISLAAANRDPLRYDRPDDLVFGRSGPRSITFGGGPHFCLGSHLGKLEGRAALKVLVPLLRPAALESAPELSFGGGGLPFMRQVSEWEIPILRG